MSTTQLKISALFWHTNIPPSEYELLVAEGDQIPIIQCNYSRNKYLYIVAWVYLNYSVRNSDLENFALEETDVAQISRFIERLQYLQRIVMNGMTHHQSNILYIDRLVNNRQPQNQERTLLWNNNRRRRIIDFNNYHYDPAALGVLNFNNKFKFVIEEVGNSNDFAKEQLTECPICYESISESCVIMGCKHSTCSGCFISYLKTRKSDSICCSLCRANIISVKTYDNEFIPHLKKYSSMTGDCNNNNDDDSIHDPEIQTPHIPEVFDEGDNIVINFV
jgi:hypothetical protein